MRRIALLLFGLLAVALVASQLALPALGERRVAERLEEDGGTAEVSLSARPALRLLFGDGDKLRITGRGLDLDPSRDRHSLSRLDGFGEVIVRLEELTAGPLDVSSFVLERRSEAPSYSLRIVARTAPREVATFLGSQAGGAFGGLLGGLAGGALPGAEAEVPLDLRARVVSRDGQAEVTAVRGEVAGLPAGPLAGIVMDAVVRRL